MSIFHSVKAQGASAEAAIAAAVGEAMGGYGDEAHNIHVMITSVFQVGDHWVAIVRVIAEPQLDNEGEEELTPAQKEERERKERELREERDLLALEKKEEMEEAAEEMMQDMPQEPADQSFLYVYTNDQDHYEALVPLYQHEDNTHLHYIEDGPLWEQIKEGFFPHDDFYEATHHEQAQHWHEFHDTLHGLNQNYSRQRRPGGMEFNEEM